MNAEEAAPTRTAGSRRPDTPARRRVRLAVPLAVLATAAVLTALLLTAGGGDDGDSPPSAVPREPAPVAVTSDAPRHATLEALAASSDVVVRGRVTATERGRVFGDPGSDSTIESRLVTLEVVEVLRGRGAAGVVAGASVLVEEEGWLPDGAPLVVDGAAPSAVGDDGIWFLVAGGDPELGAFVVVGAQGRYLVDGSGRLWGAAGDDPLVAELAALTVDGLAIRIRAVPPGVSG